MKEKKDAPERADSPVPPELSWVKVIGLGVACAVSGNFSGWNLGLGIGGWGGMACAALIMAAFYTLVVRCVAELASAVPGQGMDSYAGFGLGRNGGFVAGMSVAVAMSLAVGLGVSFIGAYCRSVFGIGGWLVEAPLLLGLIGVQLRGAREAVGFTMTLGFISVLIVALFCIAAAPHFRTENLYSAHEGGKALVRNGLSGIIGCLPYALFLFLGVEQAANAAGDMGEGRRHLPKALFTATAITLCVGLSSLLVATGIAGVENLANAGDPLYAAITSKSGYPSHSLISRMVGGGAILSLVGTVFSFAYGASTQYRSLAATGLLPALFSRTNSRGAPHWALTLVGLVGFFASICDPSQILVVIISCLTVCIQLVLLSFLRLRLYRSDIARPYRAGAGKTSALVAILLSLLVVWVCSGLQRTALTYVASGYVALALYLWSETHRKRFFRQGKVG